MALYNFIKPLGIVTYILLLLTIATGVLKSKFHVSWIKMKWHTRLGILTIVLATIHAGLVIYVNL